MTGNFLYANAAQSGGGLYGWGTLSGNIFKSNFAAQYGGGLLLYGGSILSGNIIISNAAQLGGGGLAMTAGGIGTAQNDILANNTSPLGGVYLTGGRLDARHLTLVNNGDYALTSNGGSAALTNTIVASNAVGGLSGIGITADHTLFFNSGTNCSSGASCTNSITGDPRFINPAAGDYHIGPGSAAIDAGINVGVTDDIDGDIRPLRSGFDIGADEFPYPPAASFTSSSPDWVGQGTVFTNSTVVTSVVVSYLWNFGDGAFSTAVSPTHAYTAPGVYTVVLTASNPAGTSVASDTVTIYAASFTSNGPRPFGQAMVFTNTTVTSGTTTYVWDFGDGLMSTLESPTHTYSISGSFTVVLTATNFAGSGVATGTVLVDSLAPTGTVVINDNAAYATSHAVTLTLAASDDLSGVSDMAFSDDGVSFTVFEPYTPSKAWTLPAGDGLKAVYARFRDAVGNVSAIVSDTITLDTVAPNGSIVVNGGAVYATNVSATLTLSATDSTSGLAQMQFSNDGLSWSSGEPFTTTKAWMLMSGDGLETVYVRYSDNAGNASVFSDTITLDTTPPASAVNPLPTYQAALTFTVSWSGADMLSGLASFDVQFKDGAGGAWTDWLTDTTQTSATFAGTDGHTYYFQSRAGDVLGNTEPYPDGNGDTHTTVDVTAPTGTVQIDGGATYSPVPTVMLTLAASDATSGISDVQASNDGVSFSAWETYTMLKGWTLTSGDGQKAVYARFRDAAGNVSAIYSDTIILDTTAPTDTIQINDGATNTAIPTVTLTLDAHDINGVAMMRFSNDGATFTAWLPYSLMHTWRLADGDGVRTAYVQYRDAAENISQAYVDTIILDVTSPSAIVDVLAPYQTVPTFTVTWSGTDATSGLASYDVQYYQNGSGLIWTDWLTNTTTTSASFTGQDGQTYGFRVRARDNAGNVGDYSSGDTQTTVDTTPPTPGDLTINGGALSTTAINVTLGLSAADTTSGVSDMSLSNDGSAWSEWQSYATHASWSLLSGDGIKTVYARFRDVAGNVSSPVSNTIALDTAAGAEYGATINDGALFTNQTAVTLTISARPGTTQMQVSNDGGFAGAQWEPYTSHKAWTITQYGSYVIPRVVYVRYKDLGGSVSSNYQDDIILDVTPPTGTVSIVGATGLQAMASTVTLKLSATDDVSGVGQMLISNQADFVGASWEVYATSRAWALGSNTAVYVRFRDNAGNVSQTYSAGSWKVFLPLILK